MSLLFRLLGRPACVLCRQGLEQQTILCTKKSLIQYSIGQGKRYVVLGSPLTEGISNTARKAVGTWLLGCAGMTAGAIILGGLTRLTESGLSMVDWKLIRGMKPPLSQAEWEAEFNKYKMYPEYHYKTGTEEMTLSDFKFIWTLEYLHRMWGRTIGVVFIVPAGFFWWKKWLTPAMKRRVGIMGGLLMAQGLMGWYMVKSGLDPSKNSNANLPRVSQYRLATHLSLAFVLYTMLLWTGLGHTFKPFDHTHIPKIGTLRALAHSSKTAMFITAIIGAFVAGLDGGLVYNSWPKFADRWIPEDLMSKIPKWTNFTENPVMVQFLHREFAYLTLGLVSATWLVGRGMPLGPRAKLALHGLFLMGYAQVGLGIFTILHFVPTWLASLHQQGSIVLLTFAFWLTSEIRRIPK